MAECVTGHENDKVSKFSSHTGFFSFSDSICGECALHKDIVLLFPNFVTRVWSHLEMPLNKYHLLQWKHLVRLISARLVS